MENLFENTYNSLVECDKAMNKKIELSIKEQYFRSKLIDLCSGIISQFHALVDNTDFEGGEWSCTDASTGQYGRYIRKSLYQFYEGSEKPVTINLRHYSKERIESIINSYGYTLYESKDHHQNIKELYPADSGPYNADWIIAECIFETEKAPLNP